MNENNSFIHKIKWIFISSLAFFILMLMISKYFLRELLLLVLSLFSKISFSVLQLTNTSNQKHYCMDAWKKIIVLFFKLHNIFYIFLIFEATITSLKLSCFSVTFSKLYLVLNFHCKNTYHQTLINIITKILIPLKKTLLQHILY